MKYIFRYSLLNNYTNKQQVITSQQLNQALKTVKYNLSGKNLQNMIEKCKECIQILLINNQKKDVEGLIREKFEKQNFSDTQYNEILTVWQSQKYLIFKKIIQQNTKSSQNYGGLKWSVRNSISSKRNITNQKSVSLQLKTSKSISQVYLNRESVQNIVQKLSSAEKFLSQLFNSS